MRTPVALLPTITVLALLAALGGNASAQRPNRQGKDVVDAVCGACHTSGKDGAPRIGDTAAWATRAGQGLTALTKHAISGIRKMPAHGGNGGVSDVELERAIVYMVNHSGGHWVEPVANGSTSVVRTSESIVRSQCAQCHESGTQGAPKIGDRAAWTPRLAKGLDALVASAVHGHGPMPARGGMPELSETDLRGAIVYMFNYGLPPVPPPPPAAAADPHHKLVSGLDVYFGMLEAETMRAAQAQKVGAAGMDIPSGPGYYHLSVALKDHKSQAPVSNAKVTMKVSDGMSVESKTLGPVAANNAVSYGNFFKFTSGNAYNITTEIRRPGVPGSVTANFEFRAP
ncbi:MAG TPA: c-type cytochrome [Ramlibacter sp.]|nr:c-type cytochrome [Ramlibacter sp.]